jgi:hypothetical protein
MLGEILRFLTTVGVHGSIATPRRPQKRKKPPEVVFDKVI